MGGPYGKSEPLIFNHFECLRGICTKSGLIRSLKHYYEHNKEAKAANYTVFDTTPTTFLVQTQKDDSSLTGFNNRFKELANGGSRRERVP